MKTYRLFACVLACLLLPLAGRAQDPKPAPSQPGLQRLRDELGDVPPEERQARLRQMREQYGQGNAQPGMMAGRMGGIERVFMVLTPEQRESVRKAAEADRDKVRDLEEKLRDARKAAMESAIGKDFNEVTLRQKLEAAAKLDTELTVLRARTLAKVEPPLSDEQIERIKNPPPVGVMFRDRPSAAPGENPFRNPNRSGQRPPLDPPDDTNHTPPPQP